MPQQNLKNVKKNCKKQKLPVAKETLNLYNITRLSGRPPITNSPVKDSKGNVISKNEQLKRWKEHFQEVLNRPPPIITSDIEEGLILDINIENISRDEMERAIRQLKMENQEE